MDLDELLYVAVGLLALGALLGAAVGAWLHGRYVAELRALTERVAALEERLAGLQQGPVQAAAPVTPIAPEDILSLEPPSVVAPAPPPRPHTDIETLIGGRWLNRLGLLLVFLGAFYALKWEFDNNVLGPSGRVALWALIGAGLIAYGQWLLARGHRYLAEGLTGLGGAVLYLTLYFAWDYYKLFPPGAAFLAMIFVTGAMLAIAVGRDSQRIALVGLIGGFATPLLTSRGEDAQAVLFSYLLILDASLLVLARVRNWRGLEPLALAASLAFFWGWYERFYHVAEPLARTAAWATAFCSLFTALPVIRARAGRLPFPEQVGLVLLNAANYLLLLYVLLWPGHRWSLTLAVVALAALHLVVSEATPGSSAGPPVTRMLFAGLALTFVALAIPIRLDGHWITMAWAVQGAVLVWSGFKVNWSFLRGAGLLLYGVAVCRLVLSPPHAEAFLFNPRFATFAVVLAAIAAAVVLWRRHSAEVTGDERGTFRALAVAFNVLAVWALSLEVGQYFQAEERSGADRRTAELSEALTLSLLWTAYAAGLVVAGVRQALAGLRWQGLVLFGLVVAKVFIHDLSFLSGGHRVLSSIVLGVVLLAVSFGYQRRMSAPAVK